MRRSHLLIVIWLSVCGSAFTEAQAQPRLYGCSRSTIEAYPEEEKLPVLQFLNEGRALADRSVQLFTEGRIKELYAMMSTTFKKDTTEAGFREKLAALEQGQGKVLEREYRNQSLSYSVPSEIDFQRDHSFVLYTVKTTAREDGAFLGVYTRREGNEPVVVNIDMSQFSPDTPAELRYPPPPRKVACPFIEGHLKVKAPR